MQALIDFRTTDLISTFDIVGVFWIVGMAALIRMHYVHIVCAMVCTICVNIAHSTNANSGGECQCKCCDFDCSKIDRRFCHSNSPFV